MIRLFAPDGVTGVMSVRHVIEWFEGVEAQEAYATAAMAERRRQWRLFIQAYGDRDYRECRPLDLLDFINSQKRVRSNWTRRRIKSTITKPFKTAVELGLIDRNPFVGGIRFKAGKNGRDWTQNEYQAILRGSPPYFRRYLVFLRFGGARPGEGKTLTWAEVKHDVDAIVKVDHKTSYTGASRRIHFNHVLVKLLIWLRRNKAHQQWVFVNSLGHAWTTRALTKFFKALRTRLGLPNDLKLHGARHTFATNALLNGVDVATLAELLGHRSIQSTQRYLHLVDKKEHLNTAMNRAIGKSKNS